MSEGELSSLVMQSFLSYCVWCEDLQLFHYFVTNVLNCATNSQTELFRWIFPLCSVAKWSLLKSTVESTTPKIHCGSKKRFQIKQPCSCFASQQLLNWVKMQSRFILGRKWPQSLTPVSYNNREHSAAVSIICQVKSRSSSLACFFSVSPLFS